MAVSDILFLLTCNDWIPCEWLPILSEDEWNTLKIETQTSPISHAVVDQEAPQLNVVSWKLTCSWKRTARWQGNCSTAWHITPCHAADDSNFEMLKSLFLLCSLLTYKWTQKDILMCLHSCFDGLLKTVTSSTSWLKMKAGSSILTNKQKWWSMGWLHMTSPRKKVSTVIGTVVWDPD